MCKCSSGAIKNFMKIMMIEFYSILRFIKGFYNGVELAFDLFVISIYFLMKTEKKFSGIEYTRSNRVWRKSFGVIL